ncbi:putative membrane protein, partial [Vibrio parahaemolyticus 10296]
WVLNLVISTKT